MILLPITLVITAQSDKKVIKVQLMDYGKMTSETRAILSHSTIPIDQLTSSLFVKFEGSYKELPIDDRTFNHYFFGELHQERKQFPDSILVEVEPLHVMEKDFLIAKHVRMK